MAFYKIDPKALVDSVTLSSLGLLDGDYFTVRLVGDMDPWPSNTVSYGRDAFRSNFARYDGVDYFIYEYVSEGNYNDAAAVIYFSGNLTINFPSYDVGGTGDNTDIDGDYGVIIERLRTFTQGNDVVDFRASITSSFPEAQYIPSYSPLIYDLFHRAGDGDDFVYLPDTSSSQLIPSYTFDPNARFRAEGGNDTVIGGDMNDVVEGNAGNDVLYGGLGTDILFGEDHNDKLFGGSDNDGLYGQLGDDRVIGGAGFDTVDGGSGSDEVYGGIGNDTLRADADGTDIILGGAGRDTFEFLAPRDFAGTPRAFFNLQKANIDNRDRGVDQSIGVAVAGNDVVTLGATEVADFNGEQHSLVKVDIVITRSADGRANAQVFFDGKLDTALTDAWNRNDGVAGEGMWFDTLTPIDAGSYAGFYRYSSNALNRVIALEDWTGAGQTILQNSPYAGAPDIQRQFILIHSGNSNGKSEGCFLGGNLGTVPAFFNKLDALIPGNDMNLVAPGAFYFPVVPVTVTVVGDVPQPKIVGTAAKTVEPTAGNSTAVMRFDVINDLFAGVQGVAEKCVQVFFKIAAGTTATLGTDWDFASVLSTTRPGVAGRGESGGHGTIWIEQDAVNPANRIYGVQIGTQNGRMLSDVGIALDIFADALAEGTETVAFRIVDFDLFTRAGSGWKLYARSNDSDTDGRANEAETLLFQPGREFARLTITDPLGGAAAQDVWPDSGGMTDTLFL